MSERIACPCGTVWHPAPSIAKAHQGDPTPIKYVVTPDEDIYGNRVGMSRKPTSRWVSTGPSAPMRWEPTPTESRYLWDCTCGQRLFLVAPRTYLVTCQHDAGTSGMCAVAAIQKNPPSDLYANARYGGACPCCGHQGTHQVTWDQAAPCGARPALAPTPPL